jgi:glutathione synthase/RimK-type ligase-like ATP-grasp enzyme
MNKIIFTGKHGRPSTKLAWSFIDTNLNNPIRLVQRRQFTKRNGKFVQYYRVFGDSSLYDESQLYQLRFKNFNFDNSIIIRWGTRENITYNNSIIYNKSGAIANATDKLVSRQLFIEKGVNTPRLLNHIDDYNGGIIIARPFIHSKGKNFVILNNKEELENHWRNNWYYSEFVDKVREFRVHVGHSKVLAFMEKHNPGNGSIAWNRAVNDSEPFTRVKQSEADDQNLLPVLQEAIKAVNALGLDMGGVDVILDKNGVAYVLEVNTAPTLNSSPRVAEMWSKYWSWLLRVNVKRDHWDYTQFKKASSLFWKQDQLNN